MATNTTNTFTNHTGNGSEVNFSISFSYILTSDIDVTVAGVLKTLGTHYTISGSTVTFTSGNVPANGAAIKFQRDTSISTKAVDFQDGSVLTEQDLDNNTNQVLFAQQEITDKLNGIEEGATADQTAAEIRTLTESASDSNVFTDADHSKLNGIEDNATRDQTASEIRTLVESASDSNVFTDADHSKLNGIESGATGDQTAAEIRTLVESASDSNVFTDADHTKLNAIEPNATADQTVSEIKSLIAGSPLDASHLAANSVDTSEIASGAIDSTKLNPNTVITASEQASATPNDTSFLTSAAADARFFNISSGDTIKDGQSFPDNDTTIATTAAINDRIIDLVDDVGGFVPIANETSFPTANPDAENGTGTIVSVKAASTNLTPSGTTVTIANGAGTGNTVTITGVPSVIPSGFGFLVETTTTLHTYTFHRLVPKATEVTTVAGKAVEIGRLGTADAVADMALLGTTDVVADMNLLATSDVVADMALLATTDVIADMALLAVADVISDMNLLATSDNITAMDTCRDNISSITNASNNISSVNNFGDKYQVASSDPSTDGGGNALAVGDLYFNTSANELKVYNGSSWQGGVTAAGNFASITGNTFTGDNIYTDNTKAKFGTGSDLELFYTGSAGILRNTGSGDLTITCDSRIILGKINGEKAIEINPDGNVELYYDDSKKFETTSTGATITGNLAFGDNGKASFGGSGDLQIFHNGSNSLINDLGTGGVIIAASKTNIMNAAAGENMAVFNDNGSVELYNDGSKILETKSNGLRLFGDSTQSQIQLKTSDGTNRGYLYADSNDIVYIADAQGHSILRGIKDGAAELYYDNSKKLDTFASGVTVYGNLALNNNGKLAVGNSADLQIYHDGTNSIIDNTTGELRIQNDSTVRLMATNFNVVDENNSDTIINAASDGAVELYYDNSKMFETLSVGTKTYGQHQISTGDNSYLALLNTNGQGTSYIRNYQGNLLIESPNNITLELGSSSEIGLYAVKNGSVSLYYDNSKRLETTTTGWKTQKAGSAECIIGSTDGDGAYLYLDGDANGDASGSDYAYIGMTNQGVLRIHNFKNEDLEFANNNIVRARFTSSGHFVPQTNNTYDLGSTGARWANVYTNDLNLSNEGGKNDVDGTWGSYTIQEGAEDLFLINKRNGKKYKFALAEVA
jgi:hypothetical protein